MMIEEAKRCSISEMLQLKIANQSYTSVKEKEEYIPDKNVLSSVEIT